MSHDRRIDTENVVHFTQWNTTQLLRKDEDIMNFAGKGMELENIILSEVVETQMDLHNMDSPISGYWA